MIDIPVHNTILLRGVFFSQVQSIEEKHVETIMAKKNNVNIKKIVDRTSIALNNIREIKFKNKKQWVDAYKDKQIRCWHCTLAFNNAPMFIPMRVRDTQKGEEFDTHGLFCDFPCTYSFIRSKAEFLIDKSISDKIMMLKMLYKIIHGRKVDEFLIAPNPYDMIIYGGEIEMNEYRNEMKRVSELIKSNSKLITKKNAKN